MSIRKLKGEYHVCCDAPGCDASLNSQIRSSKTQAWHVAKVRCWTAHQIGPVWRHFHCWSCYNAFVNPVDMAGE